MSRDTRPISWLKGARKDFEDFPSGAQTDLARALTILAEGRMPDIAKPLTGFGPGSWRPGTAAMPFGSSML
jgi:phage-related protein